jgi:hypothetical protein
MSKVANSLWRDIRPSWFLTLNLRQTTPLSG